MKENIKISKKIDNIESFIANVIGTDIIISEENFKQFTIFKAINTNNDWTQQNEEKFWIFVKNFYEEIVSSKGINEKNTKRLKKYKKRFTWFCIIILLIAFYVQIIVYKGDILINSINETQDSIKEKKEVIYEQLKSCLKYSDKEAIIDLQKSYIEIEKEYTDYEEFLAHFETWDYVHYLFVDNKNDKREIDNKKKKDTSILYDSIINSLNWIEIEFDSIVYVNGLIFTTIFSDNNYIKIQNQSQIENNIQYKTLNSYLLPFLFGIIGASIYILYQIIKFPFKTKDNMLFLNNPVLNILIGGFSGIFISYFISLPDFSIENDIYIISLTTNGLAIFAGYNYNLLFMIFEKINSSIKSLFEKKTTK